MSEARTVKVWDPLVRVFHWTLVIAFFTAYLTEDDFLIQHVWAGYVVGLAVIFRVVWGFIGTVHARFDDFVRSPSVTFAYLNALVRGGDARYVGHNPAGAAMILALLICLSVTTISGLYVYAYEEGEGPVAGLVTKERRTDGHHERHEAHDEHEDDDDDDRHEDEGAEEFWEELHEIFANLTLLLVFFHVAGVIYSGYLHQENLVKAMFTGRKEAR